MCRGSRMTEDSQAQIAELHRLPAAELEQRYLALTGRPARSTHRAFLARRLAWQLQALQFGGLPDDARRLLAGLAQSLDPLAEAATKPRRRSPLRLDAQTDEDKTAKPPHRPREIRLPGPGTTIRRVYQGREIAVRVLEQGFEYDGQHYRSLTAVAEAITAAHWNGLLFFGLIRQHRKDLHAKASSRSA